MMGKTKETLGQATGDTQMQAEGKVEQVEAKISQAVEGAKDKAAEVIGNLAGLQDKAKEMMGKTKETLGQATGDTQMQAEGKVEQVEAKISQAVEGAKDKAAEVIGNLADKTKEMLG
jgi:uncharacterized protein YjbJ (UPF0337 family)